jgi:hypothetical protein
LARFDIGGYTRYNVQRVAHGRGVIRPSTFSALENVGIYAKDIEGWIEASEVVYAAKLVKAAEVADYWRSIAPKWGDHDPKGAKPPTGLGGGGTGVPNNPGDYGPSIKVFRDGRNVKVGSDLIPLAEFLEYGTHKMEAFACGARTLERFGGGKVDAEARVSDKLFVG